MQLTESCLGKTFQQVWGRQPRTAGYAGGASYLRIGIKIGFIPETMISTDSTGTVRKN